MDQIVEFDMADIRAMRPETVQTLANAARDVGFLTVSGGVLGPDRVRATIEAYADFFHQPGALKAPVDMALTGSNHGWGRSGSEQVDPAANPDYKEVFDCAIPLSDGHPLAADDLAVYAPNRWPASPPGFRATIEAYLSDARTEAMAILRALSMVLRGDPSAWDAAFAAPMALLRGNYYPARPAWAGARDFGIAPHTDYGCLTLLATDGTPGLEVERPGGGWQTVTVPPGTFVVNFGEMLALWSGGRIRATPHRVVGGAQERISIPLFFNPAYDADISPPGADVPILAGPYLNGRYAETYLHLQQTQR